MASIVGFFVVGFALLLLVDEQAGIAAAASAEARLDSEGEG
jgi:hypothetical protein